MDLRIKGQSILGLLRHAKDILFNNTGTTLTSTNVEDAIKEVDSNLSYIENNLVRQNYNVAVTFDSNINTYYGSYRISSDVALYGTPISTYGQSISNGYPIESTIRYVNADIYVCVTSHESGTVEATVVYTKLPI